MPLRLTIISAHRESMGGGYAQEFKACGGTIGRSLECEWALPDSKRYISSKHAMIDFQSGCYYIVDLSRNGVFINGSQHPVGKGNPQRLFDGDSIRLGEYEIQASITDDEFNPTDTAIHDSVIRAQLVSEDTSDDAPLLDEEHINDSPHLEAMLTPGGEYSDDSCLSEIATGRMSLLKDAASLGVREAADLFLEAAGLDPKDFQGVDPKILLEKAARVLNSFADGTNKLMRHRDTQNKRLGIISQHNGKTNPLSAADEYTTGLRMLLGNKNDNCLTGTEAVKTAFSELLRMQQDLINAKDDEATTPEFEYQ